MKKMISFLLFTAFFTFAMVGSLQALTVEHAVKYAAHTVAYSPDCDKIRNCSHIKQSEWDTGDDEYNEIAYRDAVEKCLIQNPSLTFKGKTVKIANVKNEVIGPENHYSKKLMITWYTWSNMGAKSPEWTFHAYDTSLYQVTPTPE